MAHGPVGFKLNRSMVWCMVTATSHVHVVVLRGACDTVYGAPAVHVATCRVQRYVCAINPSFHLWISHPRVK